jgi:predicted RecB family nuclease
MHNTQRSGAITKKETSLSSLPLQKNDAANSRFVLGCSHREVNNRNPEYADLPRRPISDRLQMRFDEGNAYEAVVFAELCKIHKVSSVREHHDPVAATSAAMKRGDKIIIGPELPTINHRSGKPDILVRHGDATLSNGNWAYLPVDVKNSKSLEGTAKAQAWFVSSLHTPWLENSSETVLGVGKPDGDHSLQLAHYWLMLVDLGYAPNIDPIAGIIDRDGSLVWRLLDDGKKSSIEESLREWNERWAAVLALRDQLPALTRPILQSECESCIWQDVCDDVLVQEQHVSLVEGVTVTVAKKLEDANIDTIPQLAALDHSLIATDAKLSAIKSLPKNIDASRVYLRGGNFPYSKRNSSAPHIPRADVEIDFDIENHDVVYLYGNYVTRRQPDGSYDKGEFVPFHYFDTSDPDTEGRLLAKFWEWLHNMVNQTLAEGKTVAVYCYAGSSAEIPRMREASVRNAHVAGVPTEDQVTDLADQPWWVDMHKIVKELHWPTRKLGLKYVAKLAGFAWDAEDAGGDNSIVWYTQACNPQDPNAIEMQAKLLQYNEDDVQATKHLRQWLHEGVSGGSWKLQSVAVLPPPHG